MTPFPARAIQAFACAIFLSVASARADGPADNRIENVRPIPPLGVEITSADRATLQEGLRALQMKVENLRKKKDLAARIADVEIFEKAVRYALEYNEFYHATNEVRAAKDLLKLGMDRASALENGETSWMRQPGLNVFGYISRIDGSAQPYGLIVPEGISPGIPRRLDAWFHGRGEKLTELNFITERLRNPGEFVPEGAFVLHLYGRYCNANKFAGEIDLLEALDDVRKRFSIDPNRIVIRGFSMGGAACWQFAVHYPGRWAAAAPGAGFSETADFLRVFQNESVDPPWWEKRLWHWYDCPDYAVNLFNLPTVAYSGEVDKQKQAADIMAKALEAEGIELTHIIGPGTAHKYHPDSRREIDQRIDSIVQVGRNPVPPKVKFQTWTLRYNESHWLRLDALDEHWARARVEAELRNGVAISTENVQALTLNFAAGTCPLELDQPPAIRIDGVELIGPRLGSDRSWTAHLRKTSGRWAVVPSNDLPGLRKRHRLQGPIDDAFMDSFIFVLPSGKGMREATAAWVESEQKHAVQHWRKQFRGDARLVLDTELTDEQIATSNLVLWGDPASNAVLRRIADRLPLRWDEEILRIGSESFPASRHVPALIYPNPLNPSRYVVLNSGFTFREYDYLNNARQIAKLPDFAVLDISVPPNSRYAGEVATAGFFDEAWRTKE